MAKQRVGNTALGAAICRLIEQYQPHDPYPYQAARIVISLLEDVGYASIELLLAEKLSPEDLLRLQRILLATTDALERLLGAPSGCLQPASLEGLKQWMATPADS